MFAQTTQSVFGQNPSLFKSQHTPTFGQQQLYGSKIFGASKPTSQLTPQNNIFGASVFGQSNKPFPNDSVSRGNAFAKPQNSLFPSGGPLNATFGSSPFGYSSGPFGNSNSINSTIGMSGGPSRTFGNIGSLNNNSFGSNIGGTNSFNNNNAFGNAGVGGFGNINNAFGSSESATVYGNTNNNAFGNSGTYGNSTGFSNIGQPVNNLNSLGNIGQTNNLGVSIGNLGNIGQTSNMSCIGNSGTSGIFGTSSSNPFSNICSNNVFGNATTKSNFFGNASGIPSSSAPLGNFAKFVPVTGADSVQKGAILQTINTKIQNISAMKEYEGKSFEEVQWEDYKIKHKDPKMQGGIFSTPSKLPSQPISNFPKPDSGTTSYFEKSQTFGTLSKPGSSFMAPTTTTSFGFGNQLTNPNLFKNELTSKPYNMFGSQAAQPQPAFIQHINQKSPNMFDTKPNQVGYSFGALSTVNNNCFDANSRTNFGFSFGQTQSSNIAQPQGVSPFGIQSQKFPNFGIQQPHNQQNSLLNYGNTDLSKGFSLQAIPLQDNAQLGASKQLLTNGLSQFGGNFGTPNTVKNLEVNSIGARYSFNTPPQYLNASNELPNFTPISSSTPQFFHSTPEQNLQDIRNLVNTFDFYGANNALNGLKPLEVDPGHYTTNPKEIEAILRGEPKQSASSVKIREGTPAKLKNYELNFNRNTTKERLFDSLDERHQNTDYGYYQVRTRKKLILNPKRIDKDHAMISKSLDDIVAMTMNIEEVKKGSRSHMIMISRAIQKNQDDNILEDGVLEKQVKNKENLANTESFHFDNKVKQRINLEQQWSEDSENDTESVYEDAVDDLSLLDTTDEFKTAQADVEEIFFCHKFYSRTSNTSSNQHSFWKRSSVQLLDPRPKKTYMPIKKIETELPNCLDTIKTLCNQYDRKSLNKVDVSCLQSCSGDYNSDTAGSANSCGVTFNRQDYYMIPEFNKVHLYTDKNGRCLIKGLTIGRLGFGNIHFLEEVNISGLNIDSIIIIEKSTITIYPDDVDKPPVGEGLNVSAQITLDNIYPKNEAHEDIINPNEEQLHELIVKLKRVGEKMGVVFKEYRAETGSWVFEVDHF